MTEFWRKMEEKKHLDSLDAILRSIRRDTRPNNMNWVEIERNNLPCQEILATNGRDFIVGYPKLLIDEIVCETEYEILSGVTHFIDIHNFKPKINQ